MDYKKEFINGAKWNSFRMLGLTLTQFLSVFIIGKFILPEEYGLFGMVNVFIGIAYIFTDAGFSNAIIYKQETDGKKLSSIFFINIFIGFFICLFSIISAPLASLYYKEPKLTKLIIITALNFVILPFGQIFISLGKKDFKFKQIALIDVFSSIIQIGFIIIFANRGYGVLALIYAKILQSLISTVLYILCNLRQYNLSFHFNYNEIREFINFGLYQLGERLTNYLRSNADYLIIGRFLGASTLGIYTLAYQLIMMPIQKINPVLTDTAFPIFVKFKDNNEILTSNYYKILRMIASIIFPIMVGLFILAPEFILKFYGEKWIEAIPIIRIYCVLALIIALVNPIGCILNVKGRPDIGFKWNIVSAIITCLFNLAGLHWGVIGITISSTLFALVISWPFDLFIRNKLSKMPVRDYFKNLKMSFIISLSMGILTFLLKIIISRFVSDLLILMMLVTVFSVLVYIYLFYRLEQQLFISVAGKITKKFENA